MRSLIMHPWRWQMGGTLTGSFVPVGLVMSNRQLGDSAWLRTICAAVRRGVVSWGWRRTKPHHLSRSSESFSVACSQHRFSSCSSSKPS